MVPDVCCLRAVPLLLLSASSFLLLYGLAPLRCLHQIVDISILLNHVMDVSAVCCIISWQPVRCCIISWTPVLSAASYHGHRCELYHIMDTSDVCCIKIMNTSDCLLHQIMDTSVCLLHIMDIMSVYFMSQRQRSAASCHGLTKPI